MNTNVTLTPEQATRLLKGKGKSRTNRGIGARAYELLAEGNHPKDVLQTIHEEFPGCDTSPACIAWYLNKLRKQARQVIEAEALRAAEAEAQEEFEGSMESLERLQAAEHRAN